MEEDSKLENILRNVAILLGVVLLAGSMYLSYDGFDQKVSGGNSGYSPLAMVIGISLALAVTVLEFITSSRIEGLNVTLKIIGLLAYGYSIWTNYLGARDLLQMDKGMAVIVALFMDIVPEPMIAWGLGEAVMHDLFKNLGSIASSSPSKKKGKGGGPQQSQNQQRPQSPYPNQPRPQQPQYHFDGKGKPQNLSHEDARSMIEQIRKNGGKK